MGERTAEQRGSIRATHPAAPDSILRVFLVLLSGIGKWTEAGTVVKAHLVLASKDNKKNMASSFPDLFIHSKKLFQDLRLVNEDCLSKCCCIFVNKPEQVVPN